MDGCLLPTDVLARLAKGGLTAPEAARLGLEPRLAAELRRDGWRGDPGALGQAGVFANRLKPELAEVAVKDAVVFQPAKIEVRETVPVVIARRHAGAVEQHLICGGIADADFVTERCARLAGIDQAKPGPRRRLAKRERFLFRRDDCGG